MNDMVDKARRLFQFLGAHQQKDEKPVQTLSAYAKAGDVISIADLYRYAQDSSGILFGTELAVALSEEVDGADIDALLVAESNAQENTVVLFRKPAPDTEPEPLPSHLAEWIVGDPQLVNSELSIAKDRNVDGSRQSFDSLDPETQRTVQRWLDSWRTWAAHTRYTSLYQRIFEIHTKVNQNADEYELVLGAGVLAMRDGDSGTINRQLFSNALEISHDKLTGDLHIGLADYGIKKEFEIIPPQLLADATLTEDVARELEGFEGSLLDRQSFEYLAAFTVNGMGTRAHYLDSWKAPNSSSDPVVSWQPTIIMRKRQQLGLAAVFADIANKIHDQGRVPDGLKSLVDPNAQTKLPGSPQPGAVFESEEEIFTPLPLNSKQLAVLKRVDTHAQTIVQGPPGTGKTHMAAALLSHLLAQGQRVLVTAETERALYELKAKLPAEIQELAVAVISSEREDIAELKTAIDTISRRSSSFDEDQAQQRMKSLQAQLKELHERRMNLLNTWVKFVDSERHGRDIPGYREPMGTAIVRWLDNQDQYGWIEQLAVTDVNSPFPLSQDC